MIGLGNRRPGIYPWFDDTYGNKFPENSWAYEGKWDMLGGTRVDPLGTIYPEDATEEELVAITHPREPTRPKPKSKPAAQKPQPTTKQLDKLDPVYQRIFEQLVNETNRMWQAEQSKQPGQRGLVWPGYKYLGPGNDLQQGPPVDELDAAAMRHDVRYATFLSEGDIPYIWAPEIDKQMIKEIHDSGMDQTWMGNFVIALWQMKYTLGLPVHHLLKYLLPPDPDTVRPGHHDPADTIWPGNEPDPDTNIPASPPQTSSEAQPSAGQDSGGDTQGGRKIGDKRPSSPNGGPENKKPKLDTCGSMSTSCASSTTDNCPLGGTSGPAPTVTTGGGGGGAPQCGGTWWGGPKWTEHTVTFSSTRQCQLIPYPKNYCAKKSWDYIPGIIVTTPWYYIDLNTWGCFIPPASFQELIETADDITPLSLKIQIHEIVAKDICQQANSQGCQISDTQTAQMLIFADEGYKFPYVLGGGQMTVPGHLPGQKYGLPRYAYRTVGTPNQWNVSCKTNCSNSETYTPFWQSNQDTELFLLENHPSQILHAGQCWEHNYNFPPLPSLKLTQYMWDTRRQDNPLIGQRIVTMDPLSDDTKRIIKVHNPQSGLVWATYKKPAMWLPGPRHRDGDYIEIPPFDPKDNDPKHASLPPHADPTTFKLNPIVVTRQGRYGAWGKSDPCTININYTEQPGPATQDRAVRYNDMSVLLTTNTLAVKPVENTYEGGFRDHNNPYFSEPSSAQKPEADTVLVRPVIMNQRGMQQPAEPLHINERMWGLVRKDIDWYPQDPQGCKEITYGATEGQAVEHNTEFLDGQIWEQKPNTDGPVSSRPPLAPYGIRDPPPMIFLRMLPTPGPPPCTETQVYQKVSDSQINQYMNFLLSFELTLAYTRRLKTNRWNPINPAQLPPGPATGGIFNLDENGSYQMPYEAWTFKNRPRHRR